MTYECIASLQHELVFYKSEIKKHEKEAHCDLREIYGLPENEKVV